MTKLITVLLNMAKSFFMSYVQSWLSKTQTPQTELLFS